MCPNNNLLKHARPRELQSLTMGSNEPSPGSSRGKAYQTAVDYGIDVSQLEFLLTLTPLERIRCHDGALNLVIAARAAGIRYYGFDPRSPKTA